MLSFHHFLPTLASFCILGFPFSSCSVSPLKMGCRRNRIFISFVFLLILSTAHFIQARPNPKSDYFSQTVTEDEILLRGEIGSRPPRCEGWCNSCGHCEAIQVPTNPQVHGVEKNLPHFSDVANARRDDYSSYKPLSWKCKCGNLIFNP